MESDWKNKAEYWIELAQYDLDTAKTMLKGRRYLYVGFMCHQVIEKSLKAATWSKVKSEPEYIHSLSRLLAKSGIEAEIPENLQDLIDLLEPMNIEARYPTHKEKILASLTRKRCKEILENTRELFIWIKKQL